MLISECLGKWPVFDSSEVVLTLPWPFWTDFSYFLRSEKALAWELKLMPRSLGKPENLLVSGHTFSFTSWADTLKASPIMMREEKEEVSGNSSQVCPEEVLRA